MKSAMGDAIFAPLYRVLQARGVKIELLHRLTAVTPDGAGKGIETLTLARQANTLNRQAYDPFVRVKDQDCWPCEPCWDQLENGAALQQKGVDFENSADGTHVGHLVLKRGDGDFDHVILAVPPDTLKAVAPALRNPRWRAMLAAAHSVGTETSQLWLDVPSQSLGFGFPTPVTAYVEPFATWADMSHLLSQETWPAPAPKSVHYFCGPLFLDPGQSTPHARSGGRRGSLATRRAWCNLVRHSGRPHRGKHDRRPIRPRQHGSLRALCPGAARVG